MRDIIMFRLLKPNPSSHFIPIKNKPLLRNAIRKCFFCIGATSYRRIVQPRKVYYFPKVKLNICKLHLQTPRCHSISNKLLNISRDICKESKSKSEDVTKISEVIKGEQLLEGNVGCDIIKQTVIPIVPKRECKIKEFNDSVKSNVETENEVNKYSQDHKFQMQCITTGDKKCLKKGGSYIWPSSLFKKNLFYEQDVGNAKGDLDYTPFSEKLFKTDSLTNELIIKPDKPIKPNINLNTEIKEIATPCAIEKNYSTNDFSRMNISTKNSLNSNLCNLNDISYTSENVQSYKTVKPKSSKTNMLLPLKTKKNIETFSSNHNIESISVNKKSRREKSNKIALLVPKEKNTKLGTSQPSGGYMQFLEKVLTGGVNHFKGNNSQSTKSTADTFIAKKNKLMVNTIDLKEKDPNSQSKQEMKNLSHDSSEDTNKTNDNHVQKSYHMVKENSMSAEEANIESEYWPDLNLNRDKSIFSCPQLNLDSSKKTDFEILKNPLSKDEVGGTDNFSQTPSLLNIISSVNRSAIILNKDLYVTDKIIKKINEEKEKKVGVKPENDNSINKLGASGASTLENSETKGSIPRITYGNEVSQLFSRKKNIDEKELLEGNVATCNDGEVKPESKTEINLFNTLAASAENLTLENSEGSFPNIIMCNKEIPYMNEENEIIQPSSTNKYINNEKTFEENFDMLASKLDHSPTSNNLSTYENGQPVSSNFLQFMKNIYLNKVDENSSEQKNDHILHYSGSMFTPEREQNVINHKNSLIDLSLFAALGSVVTSSKKQDSLHGPNRKCSTQKPPVDSSKQSDIVKPPFVETAVSETIIKITKVDNRVNIESLETQTYVDRRLPIPFSIISFYQENGTVNTLYKHTQLIDYVKRKLEMNSDDNITKNSNKNLTQPLDIVPITKEDISPTAKSKMLGGDTYSPRRNKLSFNENSGMMNKGFKNRNPSRTRFRSKRSNKKIFVPVKVIKSKETGRVMQISPEELYHIINSFPKRGNQKTQPTNKSKIADQKKVTTVNQKEQKSGFNNPNSMTERKKSLNTKCKIATKDYNFTNNDVKIVKQILEERKKMLMLSDGTSKKPFKKLKVVNQRTSEQTKGHNSNKSKLKKQSGKLKKFFSGEFSDKKIGMGVPSKKDIAGPLSKPDDSKINFRSQQAFNERKVPIKEPIVLPKSGEQDSKLIKNLVEKMQKFPFINQARTEPYQKPKGGVLSLNQEANMKDLLPKLPSVVNVLNSTVTTNTLKNINKWEKKLVSNLGKDGFQKFYEGSIGEELEFLDCINKYLKGMPIVTSKLKPCTSNCLRSVEWILKDLSDVGYVDSLVVHPTLGYKGVVNTIAKYRNVPVVIEWKQASNPIKSIEALYDTPLLLSAYVGALNYDPNYKFQVKGALIVVSYTNGAPAQLFQLSHSDIDTYWKLWLKRYQNFLQKLM